MFPPADFGHVEVSFIQNRPDEGTVSATVDLQCDEASSKPSA